MADEGKAVIVLAAEDRTGPAFQSAQRNLRAMQKEANNLAQKNAQLAFQLNDLFVQIASGGNPLLALVQQGSQLSGTFGGVGNALRAVLGLLTPARLAFGGIAGAIGAVGIAAFKGAQDAKALQDALTLSGNFAGQTQGQFDALAKSIAASSAVTQGSARDFAQAIAATGQIGPELFSSATEAAARFGEATGKTADEVAKEFAGMSQDVAKFAADYNRSLNFITGAQFAQIQALQDAGREVEAQKIVYDALNERLRKLDDNLGYIDRALNFGAKTWSNWWEAAKGLGKAETVEDQLASVQKRLQELSGATPFKNAGLGESIQAAFGGEGFRQQRIGEEQAKQADLLKRAFRESENAFADSDRAATNKSGIAARQRLDKLLDQTKTAQSLSKALAENEKDFKAAAAAGVAYSDAEQKAINDATRKKFTERKRTDREPDQIRRAKLDQQVKTIQAGLEEEQASVKFNNDYLRNLYQDGEISLREFYTRQREEIDRGVTAKVEALTNERTAIENALKTTTDQSDRIQLTTRRDEISSEINQVGEDASRARALAIQDEAKAYKDLADSVRDFQAQLLQASGQDTEAEALRIETTIQRAQTLATQSGGSITQDQIQTLREQLTIRSQINKAQQDFGLLSAQASNAEERVALQARRNGTGLLETEEQVKEVRQQSLTQLDTLIKRVETYAASTKDPAILQFLDDLKLRYEQLQESVDPRKLRFDAAADNIGSAIADGLERAVVEGGKLSDILKGIERDIVSIITREAITKPLAAGIGNILKGTGSFSDLGAIFGIGGQKKGTVEASPLTTAVGAVTGGAGFLGGLLGGEQSSTLTETVSQTTQAFSFLTNSATEQAAATQAASSAMASLPSVVQSVTSVLSSFGGDILSSVSSLFSGGGEGGGALSFFASFFHEGGVVGQDKDIRQVFGSAPRYHTGGIAGLKADEVPSVLLKGEEVLTKTDPRHRDNLSTKVFERLQSMKEGASLTSLEGFDTSSIATEKLIERMVSDREESDSWSEVTRYHTGGIAGLAPDEVPAVLRKGEEVLTDADPRHRDNFDGARSQVIQVQVTAAPNMSRATALQQGEQIGKGIQRAMGRNG